jgi:hypothetical protein
MTARAFKVENATRSQLIIVLLAFGKKNLLSRDYGSSKNKTMTVARTSKPMTSAPGHRS